MAFYMQENIKLRDAITMPLKQKYRIWSVSGCHVKCEKIPENSYVKKTFIIKFPDEHLQLGILLAGDLKGFGNIVATFSRWEELQDKFSHLLDLDGDLIACG